jgi:hypothetical protein
MKILGSTLSWPCILYKPIQESRHEALRFSDTVQNSFDITEISSLLADFKNELYKG